MMVTSSAIAGASISAHAQVGSGTWYGLQAAGASEMYAGTALARAHETCYYIMTSIWLASYSCRTRKCQGFERESVVGLLTAGRSRTPTLTGQDELLSSRGGSTPRQAGQLDAQVDESGELHQLRQAVDDVLQPGQANTS